MPRIALTSVKVAGDSAAWRSGRSRRVVAGVTARARAKASHGFVTQIKKHAGRTLAAGATPS
jgi:hypothetical protein